jgi:hypothetical protein
MTKRFSSTAKVHALALALVLALAACSSSGSSGDGGTGSDASGGGGLLPPTHSGVTAAQCASAVDLNALGALAGDTVTIHGSTSQPTTEMAAPCNPDVTGQQVFRYHVRGENVWLHVTTNNPGGTALLDTVVWVLDGACSEGAAVLACNDDDGAAENNAEGTSTLNAGSYARGRELTLVVGAYARTRRGAQSRGDFTLTVTESPSASAGAVCNSAVPGGCVAGLECASTSVTTGVCVTPGMETEPNDTPATATPIGAVGNGIAVHAAIQPAGDTDCFSFQVAQGQTLWIEANDGGGSCGADLMAELFRSGETMSFAADDDTGRASDVACPRLFPMDNPEVRDMPAGTYILCVHVPNAAEVAPSVTLQQYSVQIAPAAM